MPFKPLSGAYEAEGRRNLFIRLRQQETTPGCRRHAAIQLVAMGRKGSGRKGFMKSVKATGSESDDELTSGTRASSDQGGPAPPLDPSQLGVRIQPDLAAESSSSLELAIPASAIQPIPECPEPPHGSNSDVAADQAELKADEQSSSGQDADDELETTETAGQLAQRHRRVCWLLVNWPEAVCSLRQQIH